MIRCPKVCGPTTSIGQIRELFRDDHLHAALIVSKGELQGVIERSDLEGPMPSHTPARIIGCDPERVTGPDVDLQVAWAAMTSTGRRRLAVINPDRQLLGLLCLKKDGLGFCSDIDARANRLDTSTVQK